MTVCSKLLIQSVIARAESHNQLIDIIGSGRGPDQVRSKKLRVPIPASVGTKEARKGVSYFAQTPHGKEAQPNNNRSKLIGIGGGFKDKGSACSRPSNTVRKRSNTANWARHRPVSIERREFQKLEQSFTVADNEQWDEDNNHKMAHTPESQGPSGATLAAEEEHILRCLGAALIMQWNALSTKLRRELFDNAGSMGELLETPALRGQVARFLHKHKDDEDYSSNMIRTEKTDAAAVARWDDEGGASQAPEQQRMRKSKIPTSHAVNR